MSNEGRKKKRNDMTPVLKKQVSRSGSKVNKADAGFSKCSKCCHDLLGGSFK